MGENIPSSPSHERNNLPTLYYGLVVFATAAILLALYNLILIRFCSSRNRASQVNTQLLNTGATTTSNRRFENSTAASLVSSFKYKKNQSGDFECSVCLSLFEDGEDVRKLPTCKHDFHAQCIDMWLYSHFDCPLCRAPVPVSHQHTEDSSGISR